jgi:hypothetical protein
VKVKVELVLAQMVVGAKATVAVGSIMVNVMVWFSALVQLGNPAVVTLTSVTVVFTAYVPTRVAVPAASNTMVWLAPLFMVYVTVAFGVPVKVKVELVLAQIVVGLNAADAVGSITVKVTVWVNALVQLGSPAVVTLTSVTVVFTVYVPTTVAVPEALSTTV